MLQGAFGSGDGIGYTLYYATNFIFTGLSCCRIFTAGCLILAVKVRLI